MNYWLWLVLGSVLLGLELILPAFYMMFFGLAAFTVGAIAFFLSPSWSVELSLFALFSLIYVLCGRYFRFYKPQSKSHPHLNNVMEEYIGQSYPLQSAIIDGRGMIKIGDSLWVVMGPDAPLGKQVRLVAIQGQAFEVQAL